MNIIRIFLTFVKMEFRYNFISSWSIFGYVVGIFVNLIVYFYTSKALAPNSAFSGTFLKYGYFEFIVLGEMILLLTQASLTQAQEIVMRLKLSGVLEQLYFSRIGVIKSILTYYIALIINNSFQIILTLLGLIVFFKVHLGFFEILRFIIIMIASSVLFLGIFYLNFIMTILFKRKNNTLQHLVNVISFFSGAYFPLEVLANEKLKSILLLSPFTALVNFSRTYIYDNKIEITYLITLLFWLIIPLVVGLVLYKLLIKPRGGSLYVIG